MSKYATAIGVDGCRSGWFFVRRRNGELDHGVTTDLNTLLEKNGPTRIAIDMPIGLRERSGDMRLCDRDARRLLGPKRSSVFTPPLRGALAFNHHADATAWQKNRCGKGLSIQAFNLCKKIAELDTLLQSSARARAALFECHPELCFFGLNNGQSVLESKKTDDGAEQRMTLLKKVLPQAPDVLENALKEHRRQDVARDDIIDALVTLYVARLPREQTLSVPLEPQHDARGLPMRITLGPADSKLTARIQSELLPLNRQQDPI